MPHALGGHNSLAEWLKPAFHATSKAMAECNIPVTLAGAPEGMTMAQCAPGETAAPAMASSAQTAAEHAVPGLLDGLRRWGQDALTTAAFLGEVALALGRLLRGKTVMRGSDYVRQLDLCGPMSLHISVFARAVRRTLTRVRSRAPLLY